MNTSEKKKQRGFLKILAFILFLAIAAVAALPTLCSTAFFQKKLISWIDQGMQGNITLENGEAGWFSPIALQGLALKDSHGQEILYVASLQIDRGLFSLWWHQTAPFNLFIEELRANISVDSAGKTNIQEAFAKRGAPSTFSPVEQMEIVKAGLQLEFTSTNHLLFAKGEGITSYQGREGGFSLHFDRKETRAVTFSLRQFPLLLAEKAIALKHREAPSLVALLGPTLDGTLTVLEDNLQLSLSSSHADAHMTATFSETPFSIAPNQYSLELRPAFVGAVLSTPQFLQPIKIEGTLSGLILDDVPPNRFSSDFTFSEAVLLQEGKSISFPAGKSFLVVNLQDKNSHVKVAFSEGSEVTGDLYFGNEIALTSLNANFAAFPVEAIPLFLPKETRELSHLLLGKTLQGVFSFDLPSKTEGTFTSQLTTSAGLSLDFTASLQGTAVRLTKAATARLNNQATMGVLWDHFLRSLGRAEALPKEWSLRIEPQGFLFNTNSPTIYGLHFDNGAVDIGNMIISAGGGLQELLSTLRIEDGRQLAIDTTPLYFSLDQGILYLSRVDFQVDHRFPFGLFGNADIGQNRGDLRLIAFQKTLTSAFRLTLPKGFTLVIPVKGPLDQLRLDKKAIAPVLATLGLSSSLPISTLWGRLAGAAHTLFTGEIPSPTTTPVPWPLDIEARETVPSEDNKKESLLPPVAEPLQQIEKKAKKIIKNIFKG